MRKITVPIIILFFLTLQPLYGAAVKSAAPEKVTPKTAEAGYLANELNSIANPDVPKAPSAVGTTVNLLVSLLFVIGVIYLVMIALKFFYVRASIPMKSEGVIKILAREYIDTKKAVYFVEVADRILILGSAGDNITTLSEITDKDTVDKIRLQADEYIAKYRMKSEAKFADELKAGYVKQGKKLVDAGNDMVQKIKDKFGKKP